MQAHRAARQVRSAGDYRQGELQAYLRCSGWAVPGRSRRYSHFSETMDTAQECLILAWPKSQFIWVEGIGVTLVNVVVASLDISNENGCIVEPLD